MYRSFESITNWQRCDLLKIFVIPGAGICPLPLGEVIIGEVHDRTGWRRINKLLLRVQLVNEIMALLLQVRLKEAMILLHR